MPKFSETGRLLSSDVMPAWRDRAGTPRRYSALGWCWLTADIAIGYAGFNTPKDDKGVDQAGLYLIDFAQPQPQMTWLARGDVETQNTLRANGLGYWISDHGTGGLLDSLGRRESGWALYDATVEGVLAARKTDFAVTRLMDASLNAVEWSTPGVNAATWVGGRLIWSNGATMFSPDAPLRSPSPWAPCSVAPDGRFWFTGQAAGGRLCAWPWDDPEHGFILSADGRDNYPTPFWTPDGWLRIATAEYTNDSAVRVYELDVAGRRWRYEGGDWQRLVDANLLTPPVAQPMFVFSHPVLVAPYKDPQGESGADAEVVCNQTGQQANRPYFVVEDSLAGPFVGECLGIYTEDPDVRVALALAVRQKTRLIYAHDALNVPSLPTGLRPCDQVWIEHYRDKTETLTESIERWTRNTFALLQEWRGDCGVVPQFYGQGGVGAAELWTVQDVLDGLTALSKLVNLSPRIKIIAPFEWQRANGITAHPEFREAFARLLAAAYLAGRPVLTPVGGPPAPVPTPIPIPTPVPVPTPAPPRVIYGGVLMAQIQGEVIEHFGSKQTFGGDIATLKADKAGAEIWEAWPDGTLRKVSGDNPGTYAKFKLNGQLATVNSPVPGQGPNVLHFIHADISGLPELP